VQIGLGLLEYDRASAVAGAISRDLIGVEPFAVYEAEEVVAGLDGRVHLGEVDAEAAVGRFGGWRRRCGRCRRGRLAAGGEQCGSNNCGKRYRTHEYPPDLQNVKPSV